VTGMMWSHDKAPYRLLLNSKAASQMAWHCDHYRSRRVMKHFSNAAGVAKEMGITVEALKASLDSYNEYASHGDGWEDPFGKIYYHNTPFEMDEEYFLAVITPVVHYTMGGLAISTKCECVYEDTSRVIPGLYAVGEVTGGVHGRNRLGGSGLAEGVVLGRQGGSCALEYMNGPKPQPAAGSGDGSTTTTTVTIPIPGQEPITVTTTTSGGAGAGNGQVVGDLVDVIEWDGEVTTQPGKITSGAAGKDGPGSKKTKEEAPAKKKPSGPPTDVALVYGSFFMGDSERDINDILAAKPEDLSGLSVSDAPIEGNDFDFNNLKDTKFLVVCTSSMYGNPPKNFWEFYYHLKAASENPNKPLAGLQHAVFGNGDETYIDTYMNVPRVVDLLLERAGSRRFYARGECGEPHAPTGEDMVEAEAWAPGMWDALKAANDAQAPSVEWAAHWEGAEPAHHDKYTDWDLSKIKKKFGSPDASSIFVAASAKL